MATETPNLGLIKPARGEFNGTWDIPMNANSDTIDGSVGGMQTEIATARGSESTLDARLSVSLNADGTLVGVPEVAQAENSPVYGANNGSTNYTLKNRIDLVDYEVFYGRQGAAALKDALANAADDSVGNTVLSAPTGFLSFTGANVKVDGSVTPVICNINGYRCTVRSLSRPQSADRQVLTTSISSVGRRSLISRDWGRTKHRQPSVNVGAGYLGVRTTQKLMTSGVQAGDILAITSSGSANAGNYVVASVIDPNNLLVIGLFQTVQANLNYSITNPLAPSLNFTSTAPSLTFEEVAAQKFIGEAVFDGTNVTSVLPYAIKGRYAGFTSITLSGEAITRPSLTTWVISPRRSCFMAARQVTFPRFSNPWQPMRRPEGFRLLSQAARQTAQPLRLRPSPLREFSLGWQLLGSEFRPTQSCLQ